MLPQERGKVMARVKTGFDSAEYNKAYQKKLHRILISFNPANKDDVKIWEHLQSKGERKKIPYIKQLIKNDMKENEP